MQYTVTYRRKDGQRDQVVLDAASRSEVFSQLKARGINAISVDEGVSKKPLARSQKTSQNHFAKGLTAGLIVVVLIIAAVLMLIRGRGPSETDAPDKDVSTVKGSAIKSFDAVKTAEDTESDTNASLAVEEELPPDKRILKDTYTIKTNGVGKIIERYRTADGKSHMVISLVEPTFVEASDQLLAMALSGRSDGLGAPPPSPGGVSEAEFRKSLETPIEIFDDDTDAVKELKQKVIDARQEALAMINEGRSLDDILAEHHKIAMENDKTRQDCQRELNELVKNGNLEAAQEYCTVMSAALQQMGIAELRMPMTEEERADLIERRKAARAEAEARRAAEAAGQKK